MRCRVGVGGHGFSNISGYQTQIPPQLGFVSGFAFSSLLAISDLIIAPFFLFSASDVQIPRLVCHHVVSWRFLSFVFPFILIPRACYTEQLPRYFRWIAYCIAQRHTPLIHAAMVFVSLLDCLPISYLVW
ncbi:hypothetical protein BO83DRAFT_115446 [Aspergillus eucalypticola CBS 122712]|uniref:Uncharacterized protein n=1 Tax=Aspergillus eucalypticola (strain CBS 122712 / IBT 29274) TaxID=1448314 RepID=A0A317UYZ3_ASPEC|nr:uncharacterized protein BO83DRAFT_115446 [Aspergillus eucalypticola CBS 122712]PWY65747.1 hypothetical protein BO83DRAFT_115446 [Aspergillus eucalypticola CBS 122712]